MEENKEKKWYKKWWGMLIVSILIFIAIFFVASVFYVIDQVNYYREYGYVDAEKIQDSQKIDALGNGFNYSFGAEKPIITIIEFGDFGCPNCKSFFSKMRELSLTEADKVKIIFRDFPLVTGGSYNLAMAARCAGEQGLFWVMHDKLFLKQGEVEETNDIYSLANEIGVDSKRFDACFKAKKFDKLIQQDIDDALALEIKGTPTWFINGYRVDGDIPEDVFNQLIEKLLGE